MDFFLFSFVFFRFRIERDVLKEETDNFIHMKIVLSILLSSLLSVVPSARNDAAFGDNLQFQNISSDNGLSYGAILSICQDNNGFIWIATSNGINKYDSSEIETFRHSRMDTCSIASNSITKVYCDHGGRIWVGTSQGLSLYNGIGFVNYSLPDNAGDILDIQETPGGHLIISCRYGLRMFDTESMLFEQKSLPSATESLKQCCFFRDVHSLYIGDSSGSLFAWDLQTGELERLPEFKSSCGINSIHVTPGGAIWVGTEGDGAYSFCDGTVSHYTKGQIESNFVRSICQDASGRIWIGTYEGLNIIKDGTVSKYRHDESDELTIPDNSIRCIFRDSQDGMWIGTWAGGVGYWNAVKNRFVFLTASSRLLNMSSNNVSCIVPDSDGSLWLGSGNCGVERIDLTSRYPKRHAIYSNSNGEEVGANDIKAICPTSSSVYVGAQGGGMSVINRMTGTVRHCGNEVKDVYDIRRIDDYTLYVASLSGLYRYSVVSGCFEKMSESSMERVVCLETLSNGDLCAGGESVEILDKNGHNNTPDGLKGIKNVQCLLESKSGTLYIASRDGLYIYDMDTGLLSEMTEDSGFPDSAIQSLEEDEFGRIWMGTGHGLTCFNPYSGSVKKYFKADGLPSSEFNPHSSCRLEDGSLMFGTRKGIVMFDPTNMAINRIAPPAYVKSISSDNNSALANVGDTVIFDKSTSGFEVSFGVVNYVSSGHNTFAYRLMPDDDKWNTLPQNNTVKYSNLKHGAHLLQVRAANNDGVWNDQTTTCTVILPPHFVQTVAFRVAAGLLVTAFVFSLYALWRRRRKAILKQHYEHLELVHKEEVHKMQVSFFVNLFHEFKTPLTLIASPIQEIMSYADNKWIQKQLRYIEGSAQRLIHIVDQTTDYRKAELGMFKLQVSRIDAGQVVEDVCRTYDGIASKKGIGFSCRLLSDNKAALCDAQYLYLILNNLLSNAFKYTDSGAVRVTLSLDEDNLMLEVSDTGIGISDEDRQHIFDRPHSTEHIGSGLGLSIVKILVDKHHGKISLISELGHGSSFMVSLPQHESDYNPEEISEITPDVTPMHNQLYNETPSADSIQDIANKRGNILIVESDPQLMSYMNESLSKTYDVFLAMTDNEAFDVICNNDIDIIVADTKASDDDYMLCRHIKTDLNTNHIPVIVLSPYSDQEKKMEAMQCGADDYVVKPFDIMLLTTKIRNILRTRARYKAQLSRDVTIDPWSITLNKEDEAFLKKAQTVVQSEISNPEFSTNDFARLMAMSRSRFYLKMRSITGESPLDFVKRIRFAAAIGLLKEGRMNITEIAEASGFNSASYFTTAFKKEFGCAPSEYLRKNKTA